MSLQISIETYLDDAQARKQQAELIAKNEQIAAAIKENKKKTKESFDDSMEAVRSYYMLLTGITQIMGGSTEQMISSLYGVAVSAIGTWQSIAAAMAVSPVPGAQFQAGLMMLSLTSALVSLGGILTGQEKLARRVNGITTGLQGIGGMLNKIPDW